MLRYFVFIFIVGNSFPQTLDGFLDIEWKSIKPQVKQIMSEIDSVELIKEENDTLTFTGGKFAGNDVKEWTFHFYNEFFYNVEVLLDTIDGQDSAIWYRALTYLQDNYGKTKEFEKLAKNKSAILWYFYDEAGDLQNLIQLTRTIREGLESEIQITYTYIPLWLANSGLEW